MGGGAAAGGGMGVGDGAGVGVGAVAAQGAEGVEGGGEGVDAGRGGVLEVELAVAQFEVLAGEFEAADGEVGFEVGALEGLEEEEEVQGGLEALGIDVEREEVAGGELGEEFGLGGGLGLAFLEQAAVAVAGEGAEGDGDLVGVLELGGDGFEGEAVVEPLVKVGEEGGVEVVEPGVGAGLAVGAGGGEVGVGHDGRRWRAGMGGRGSAVRGPSVGWQCDRGAGLGGRLPWTPWTRWGGRT